MSRRELTIPARMLTEIAPGVRVFVHGDAAAHLTIDVDDVTPPDPHRHAADVAWEELAAATVALGTAAARFEDARNRYGAARRAQA